MANVKAIYQRPMRSLDNLGEELSFYIRAIAWTPRTLRRYKKEILRLLAEVTLGSGALAVIGGTVGVITAMAFFTGTEVGLQGYAALNQIGTAAFSGLRLGLLQHPRDLPAGGRHRAGRDGRAAGSPPSSARCGSPRRSTPSR